MNTRQKNILYSLILAIAVLVVWLYRRESVPKPVQIQGKTMGTTYHITYFDSHQRNFKPQVDSLLAVFNQSLSTYLPASEITRYNEGKTLLYRSPYFLPVLEKSKEVAEASQGAFDPTVMPLVNAWGFGHTPTTSPDSLKIDSIRKFVGFHKVRFNADSVWKVDFRVQLDFGAIAKGYGVDIVTNFIASKGIENIFVEIGGEVLAKGKNIQTNQLWEVGILNPSSDYTRQSYIAYAKLENKAAATSGNYFNYYEENNKKYTHTINPKSGYPSQHEILSASVFADDCITADAWATALMVMGHRKAIATVKKQPHLDAFLVYSTENGIATFTKQSAQSFLKISPEKQVK